MGFWNKLFGRAPSTPSTASTPAEPPSPRELFMAEVEARLATTPNVVGVTRRADYGLDVSVEGEDDVLSVFLENTFLETRDLPPDARAERIRRLLSGIGEEAPELDWDSVQKKLVPLVRASTMFAGVSNERIKLPIRRPFVPFLIETVAVDSDDKFMYVTDQNARDWGVDVDTVFATARENAAEYFGVTDVELHDPSAAYPIWRVSRDDTYETSRLLLPGWLAAFGERVKGRPVAIIPERSTLLVGGDADPSCVERLVDAAEREYSASPRRISPALYTVSDAGDVIPLVLPDDHPHANDVALGHVKLALAEYDAQKGPLQAELGDEVFVASFTGIQREDGSVTSYSVWTEDVPTLLPRTEDIAMRSNADEILRIPFTAVEELAPDSLERVPDLDPPRWRTRDWPSAEVMAALRERAR